MIVISKKDKLLENFIVDFVALFVEKKMWEVVYPTSRAVELGEEDEEEDKPVFDGHLAAPVVRMSRCPHSKDDHVSTVACKLLVIAFGRIATTFIEAHFLNSDTQIVGLVSAGKKENDRNSLLQNSPSDKTCFIHSSIAEKGDSPYSEVLFCQSKIEYPGQCCHDWAKEVFSSIKADQVLVLSTLPASQCSLNGVSESESVFALKTNTCKTAVNFPFLKSPNIISDIPAAVLTHCQVFNIPAIMYVGVTETDCLDSRAIGMFNGLLDQDPLKDVSQRSKSEVLNFMKTVNVLSHHLQSNLYI